MTKVYACLVGNWVCLSDDPDCTIGDYHQRPYSWWEEGATIYAPTIRDKHMEHSLYGLDYVHVYYKHKKYRINPAFIQIVSE